MVHRKCSPLAPRLSQNERGTLATSKMLLFLQHVVNPHERGVHDLLARAHRYRRHRAVRAVATFRDCFNRREVLMVSVAVAEKEQLAHASAFLQANRMIGKELPADTDQRN